MESVKNIIFDLGGVLLNIDLQELPRHLAPHSPLDLAEITVRIKKIAAEGYFDRHEVSSLSDREFQDIFVKELNLSIDDPTFLKAWNSILLDFPVERIELLKRLKNKYRTFLLSNTNQIHLEQINSYMYSAHALENLSPLFEHVYLSHQINLRKPNREVFEYVLIDRGLVAAETAFIDDSITNVNAANSLGIKGIHLGPGMDICTLFGEI